MLYQSSRNDKIKVTSAAAILDGLAEDGGLFCPDQPIGGLTNWKALLDLDPYDMMAAILALLLPSFSADEIKPIVKASYAGKFPSGDMTPTVSVGEDEILELFHGPTCAFKDIALSVLPGLLTAACKKCGVREKMTIVAATSGDTGKAALEGFRNVPGTGIIVFYPSDGVSPIQQRQMITQEGDNVCVCAVEGNFDDIQARVKQILEITEKNERARKSGIRLSSANSINIGRLIPQIFYYFQAYRSLVKKNRICLKEPVDFVVPTGNFGDILAGFLAKEIGLPVGRLICASNSNNVLTGFFQTGTYDCRRPFFKTVSPSMDILISSNLERLLFLLSRDPGLVSGMMHALKEKGSYTVPGELKQTLDEVFYGGFCQDDQTQKMIAGVWQRYGYLMDTHTGVAYEVAQQYKTMHPDHSKVVILSTASPFKYPSVVLESLGYGPAENEFDAMKKLSLKTGIPIPESFEDLDSRPIRHRDQIKPDGMAGYVLERAKQKAWR